MSRKKKILQLQTPERVQRTSRTNYKRLAKSLYNNHLGKEIKNTDLRIIIHLERRGLGESVHGFRHLTKDYLTLINYLPIILKQAKFNNFSNQLKPHHIRKGIVGFINFVIPIEIDGVKNRWRIGIAIFRGNVYKFHYSIRIIKMRRTTNI